MEALCLSGIGEKTVARLELKLAEYCRDNDIPMPFAPKTRKYRPNPGNHDVEEAEPQAKKARSRVQKQYVPALRSGAYAILLTLLDAQTANGDGSLTKHEITTRGQVYCDASLTNPDPGKFYSAWSSMKTLLGKNLVYHSGPKFYLTGEGADIAQRMRAANDADPTNPTLLDTAEHEQPVPRVISQQQPSAKGRSHDTIKSFEDTSVPARSCTPEARRMSAASSSTHVSQTPTSYTAAYRFDYETYKSWDNTQIESASSSSSSSVTKSETIRLADPPSSSSSSSSSTQRSHWGNKDQPVNIISDSEDEADEELLSRTPSDVFKGSALLPTKSLSGSQSGITPSGLKRAPSLFKIPVPLTPTVPATSASKPSPSLGSTSAAVPSERDRVSPRSNSFKGNPTEDPTASKHDPFPHLRSNSFTLRATTNTSAPMRIDKLARFKPIVFLPGTFEICLVLDIREVRSQTDRDYIGQKLKDRGINVIKRALDIGDVIWIARLKDSSLGGLDELVLDYVVERKRMDDLVSSIKDGRFIEQKFRLRRSGLENVIYLIETYKMGETYDIGVDAIRTAMMSTQVQDGFFLRRTNHTDQTIDYLASITNALKRLYQSKTLYAIPDEAIDRASYMDLQAYMREILPDRPFLTSYKSFGTLNGKSETLVVKDTFVKMLMTIRGISSEKAIEIARVYGTPRALFSELDEVGDRPSKEQRLKMLARTGSNVGRKKISEGLTAKVIEIWNTEQYS
ncbi:Crossover junction endonuclease mus81 [Dissophora ornata]|nr:Crossover junction endonuclease mus81 [Dissophora ornata]